MASSVSLDLLVVDFLRKRGFLKTLKSFISETGLKDSGNLVQEDLATIFSAYFSSKTGGVDEKQKSKDQGSKGLPEKCSKIVPVMIEQATSSDEDEDEENGHALSVNKSKEISGSIQSMKPTESKLKVSNGESLKEPTRNGKNMMNAVKLETKAAGSSSDDSDEEDEGITAAVVSSGTATVKDVETSTSISSDEDEDEGDQVIKTAVKVATAATAAPVTVVAFSSDDSSSNSDDEEETVKPVAVVLKVKAPVASNVEEDSEVESSESEDEAVKVATAAPAAPVAEVESSSDDSSSDSDDEEETVKPVAVVPNVKALIASTMEEDSESESSESEDEAANELQVPQFEAKTDVVPSTKREGGLSDESSDSEDESIPTAPVTAVNGAVNVVVEDFDESSSDSSSDEEEDIMQDVAVKRTSTVVPNRVVTPKVSTTDIPECSDRSSDEEMEVDSSMEMPKNSATTALVNKLLAADNRQVDSSSSDSSSDDEDEEPVTKKHAKVTIANGSEAKLTVAVSTAKKRVASSLSSDSSDSSADVPARESNIPGGPAPVQTSMPPSGVKDVSSPASSSEEDDESSDESVEIKSTGGSGLRMAIKASSADDSSDSSDEEAMKPSLKTREGKTTVSHTLGTSAHKGSPLNQSTVQVISANHGTMKEVKKDVKKKSVGDSAVKKGKKDVEIADTGKTVASGPKEVDPRSKNGTTGVSSSKKRKPVEKGTDVSPANKRAKVEEVVNGELNSSEDNKGKEFVKKSPAEKTKMSAQKKTSGSASKDTPTSAKAFQRVNPSEVQLLDPRLSDNSYWAKSGAEDGWGAKAQEILGQVRGKNFRHEKTKKKRGSYKGGVIDHQSHSIKFTNSDDE